MKTLDFWEDLDRTQAIIIIDGKWFESDINHQCCLLEWQKDWCERTGNDIDTENGLAEAIRYTDDLFRNNKAYGFDVFEGSFGHEKYFVAHYQENLLACWEEAKAYADESGMGIGAFINYKGDPVLVENYAELLEICIKGKESAA